MPDIISPFNDLMDNTPRVKQQAVAPTGIKNPNLSSGLVQNTTASISGPVSLASGSSLIIQSVIASTQNKNVPVAGAPYCIVFFETTASTTTMIGVTLTGDGYRVKGPFAMPTFSPYATNLTTPTTYGGSTGNNLVYVTELYNNTGLTKNIYYITNTRVIIGFGGAAR